MGQGKRGHQLPAATLMEHSLKIPCDHRIPAAGMSSPDTEHGCLLGATPASPVWDSHGDSRVPHSLEDRQTCLLWHNWHVWHSPPCCSAHHSPGGLAGLLLSLCLFFPLETFFLSI